MLLELHSQTPLTTPLSIAPWLTLAPGQLLTAWDSLPIRRPAQFTFWGTGHTIISSLHFSQLLSGATNSPSQPCQADRMNSSIHLVLHSQGVTVSCTLLWGMGTHQAVGVLLVSKLLLCSENDSRDGRSTKLQGKTTVWSHHYLTQEHVLSWLMQHRGLTHRVPAVQQPPLTPMPSNQRVPVHPWHNLGKQDHNCTNMFNSGM